MLNRYDEAKSARTIVTRLSPEGLVRLEKWLRGLATNIICSCGGRRLEVPASEDRKIDHPRTPPLKIKNLQQKQG